MKALLREVLEWLDAALCGIGIALIVLCAWGIMAMLTMPTGG